MIEMAKLRAGAATSVLTPPLGTEMIGFFNVRLAEDVHDELHAKAFVFESGDSQVALVVCVLIALGQCVLDVGQASRTRAATQHSMDMTTSGGSSARE